MNKTSMRACGVALLVAIASSRSYAGMVGGEVRFIDAPPNLPAIKVSKDQDYCGERLTNDIYLIGPIVALKMLLYSLMRHHAAKPTRKEPTSWKTTAVATLPECWRCKEGSG